MIVLWKAYDRSPTHTRVTILVGPDRDHLDRVGIVTLGNVEWANVMLGNLDWECVDETDKPKEFGP